MLNENLPLQSRSLDALLRHVHSVESCNALVYATDPFLNALKREGFDPVIWTIQVALAGKVILSACKLFETNRRSHGIPRLLRLLENDAATLAIHDASRMVEVATRFGFSSPSTGLNDPDLTRNIVAFYRRELPSTKEDDTRPISMSLKRVRERRDKLIAHEEVVPEDWRGKVEQEDLQLLVDFAKNVIVAIGYGYFNHSFLDRTGEYHPSDERLDAALQYQQLLDRAGIPRSGPNPPILT